MEANHWEHASWRTEKGVITLYRLGTHEVLCKVSKAQLRTYARTLPPAIVTELPEKWQGGRGELPGLLRVALKLEVEPKELTLW